MDGYLDGYPQSLDKFTKKKKTNYFKYKINLNVNVCFSFVCQTIVRKNLRGQQQR